MADLNESTLARSSHPRECRLAENNRRPLVGSRHCIEPCLNGSAPPDPAHLIEGRRGCGAANMEPFSTGLSTSTTQPTNFILRKTVALPGLEPGAVGAVENRLKETTTGVADVSGGWTPSLDRPTTGKGALATDDCTIVPNALRSLLAYATDAGLDLNHPVMVEARRALTLTADLTSRGEG